MSVLTKQEMSSINLSMLGKGMPVAIDNTGYNKFDYVKMVVLAEKSELSDLDAYELALTLRNYVNTQLSHLADRIRQTVQFYQNLVKQVKVLEFTPSKVKLEWGFNYAIRDFIRNNMDKSCYRWTKDDGNWVFEIEWTSISQMFGIFSQQGFSTTEVKNVLASLGPIKENNKEDETLTLQVIRPDSTIDTLYIKFPYNATLVEVLKSIPHTTYSKQNRAWEVYIAYSLELFQKLTDLGMKSLDLSQLKPWATMVKGWKTNHRLIDWKKCPLKFKPYEFQIEDAKKLLQAKVMLNGCDMGCGKTFEQILVGESIPKAKLVICPPTLRLNWKKEILHVNPNANVHIQYSADEFTFVKGWNIIGYNSLDKFQKELEKVKFQVIMIDEAHYIQAVNNSGNPDSKRATAVLRLAATANYVYPITGTPKTNRNKNLFNILRALRHPLGMGKWAFSNYGKMFCDGHLNGFGWDYNGNSNDEELNRQLSQYMVRHLKSEVLPHLKKQRIVMPVEVDLREYHREIAEYLKNRSNGNAVDLARLMGARKILANKKVEESIAFAKNLILEDKKVVIVTCFTDVVKAVETAFKGNVVKLVGGMTDEAKDKAISEFQEGQPQVMVMNIVAGGVGVTLTKSSNMIINDFDWTPGNLTQAEDRICRGGQTQEFCNIYYLYAAGADMDEVFADTLTEKFSTINDAVDGGEGDSIDYLDLISKALQKKASQPEKAIETSSLDFKDMTLEDLIATAKNMGADCKVYENPSIYRMRLIMAIKSANK